MVDELIGVVEKEKAPLGVLITLREPTQPMTKTAAKAGFLTTPFGKFQKIQIATVADMLDGKLPKLPPQEKGGGYNRHLKKKRHRISYFRFSEIATKKAYMNWEGLMTEKKLSYGAYDGHVLTPVICIKDSGGIGWFWAGDKWKRCDLDEYLHSVGRSKAQFEDLFGQLPEPPIDEVEIDIRRSQIRWCAASATKSRKSGKPKNWAARGHANSKPK